MVKVLLEYRCSMNVLPCTDYIRESQCSLGVVFSDVICHVQSVMHLIDIKAGVFLPLFKCQFCAVTSSTCAGNRSISPDKAFRFCKKQLLDFVRNCLACTEMRYYVLGLQKRAILHLGYCDWSTKYYVISQSIF